VRRGAVLAGIVCAALAAASTASAATSECKGLQVCVPVAGPWVLATPGQTEFQLNCPKRFIVGGLDAELSRREIDIGFVGGLGSPVNPGITTSRDALFTGLYAGASPRAPTFRPHVGCVPGSGGGGGPVPYLAPGAFPPGRPTTRRVSSVVLRPNRTVRVVRGCAAGERLVGAWQAVGFFTAKPPSATLVASVGATRVSATAVRVRTGALGGARAVVQVGAVCGGGR
jgi:hypothetical protein